jgi:hypothetical protein
VRDLLIACCTQKPCVTLLTLQLVAGDPPWSLVESGQVEVRERETRYSPGKGHARTHLIISCRRESESESEGAMAERNLARTSLVVQTTHLFVLLSQIEYTVPEKLYHDCSIGTTSTDRQYGCSCGTLQYCTNSAKSLEAYIKSSYCSSQDGCTALSMQLNRNRVEKLLSLCFQYG